MPVFGFLLNSQLVSQFPNTIHSASNDSGQAVTPLRLESIGSTTLIALYAQVLGQLQLSQPVEGFLLGLNPVTSENTTSYTQFLRYFVPGSQQAVGVASTTPVSATARNASSPLQVLSFSQLFSAMQAAVSSNATEFNNAALQIQDFRLQIIAEATQVIITIDAPAASPAPAARTQPK